jgi:hypothetical protein
MLLGGGLTSLSFCESIGSLESPRAPILGNLASCRRHGRHQAWGGVHGTLEISGHPVGVAFFLPAADGIHGRTCGERGCTVNSENSQPCPRRTGT